MRSILSSEEEENSSPASIWARSIWLVMFNVSATVGVEESSAFVGGFCEDIKRKECEDVKTLRRRVDLRTDR